MEDTDRNPAWDPGSGQRRHQEAPRGLPDWLGNTPYWAMSAALHLILAVLMTLYVVFESHTPAESRERLLVAKLEEKQPAFNPIAKRLDRRRQRIIHPERKKDPIIPLKPEEIKPQLSKGTDLDRMSNKDLKSRSADDRIGIAGPGAGAYGQRGGRASLVRDGGDLDSESAVLAALHWLRRHQNDDGSWSAKDFTKKCSMKEGCRCKNPEKYGDGRGWEQHDVGVTALAVLAFTGSGNTHFSARDDPAFVEVVRKALGYLRNIQIHSDDPTEDGRIGPATGTKLLDINEKDQEGYPRYEQWIYDHALATMALSELYVLTRDFRLRRPVEKAARLCLRAQNSGYGWRYGVQPGENDTSVTGWMVLALKTVKYTPVGETLKAQLDQSFEWALNWFRRATQESTGITGYRTPGDEGSRLRDAYPDPYPYSKRLSCMTAVAVLCRLFSGEPRSSQDIRKGVDILMQDLPQWKEQRGPRLSKINLYYWYYGSYALFQTGGKDWARWNQAMKDALIKNQRQLGCEDGSWDPVGEWGKAAGRVYSTALGAMTLEVYYRYERATGEGF